MNDRRPRTLVIGVGGFIGRYVARALEAEGHLVVGLGPGSTAPAGVGVFHSGRSETTSVLATAVRGCDNVVYLGGTSRPAVGMIRVSDEIARESLHVVDIAELCAAEGVRRFLFTSSGGTVYGLTDGRPVAEARLPDPIGTYGLSKLVAEQALRLVGRRTGLEVVSLRVSNPYGPEQQVKGGQGFVAAACRALVSSEPLVIWGDGSTIRDFVYVEDVAEAYAAALRPRTPPGVYNIGSGEGTSLLDLCRRLEAAAAGRLDIDFQTGRSVDIPTIVLSIAKAASDLGWRPKVGLDDGLMRTIAWWNGYSTGSPRETNNVQ